MEANERTTPRSAWLATLPKTVKPPFWLSRLLELSPRLKKNWSVALLGLLPSLAMAIVPSRLDRLTGSGSFGTGGNVGVIASRRDGLVLNVNPPPCRTKVGNERWKMELAYL